MLHVGVCVWLMFIHVFNVCVCVSLWYAVVTSIGAFVGSSTQGVSALYVAFCVLACDGQDLGHCKW